VNLSSWPQHLYLRFINFLHFFNVNSIIHARYFILRLEYSFDLIFETHWYNLLNSIKSNMDVSFFKDYSDEIIITIQNFHGKKLLWNKNKKFVYPNKDTILAYYAVFTSHNILQLCESRHERRTFVSLHALYYGMIYFFYN